MGIEERVDEGRRGDQNPVRREHEGSQRQGPPETARHRRRAHRRSELETRVLRLRQCRAGNGKVKRSLVSFGLVWLVCRGNAGFFRLFKLLLNTPKRKSILCIYIYILYIYIKHLMTAQQSITHDKKKKLQKKIFAKKTQKK